MNLTDFSSDATSSVEEILEEARNGRMFILVDHEDRENEGDLIVPAQMATPEAINFMAKHGRGLICLALTEERTEALGLPLMPAKKLLAPRHGIHDLHRGPGGHYDRNFRARPSAHDFGRDRRAVQSGRHRHARPCLPGAGAERRRPDESGPYGGGGGHRQNGRAQPVRRDLRGHE